VARSGDVETGSAGTATERGTAEDRPVVPDASARSADAIARPGAAESGAAERGTMGDGPAAAEAIAESGAAVRCATEDGPVSAEAIGRRGGADAVAGPEDALATCVASAVAVAPPKNNRLDCWKNASICGRAGVSWGALAKSAGRVVLWMTRPAVRSNARWSACQARGSRPSSVLISRNARANGWVATARRLRHTIHAIHARSVSAKALDESTSARRMGAIGITGEIRSGRRSRMPTCSGEPGGLSGAMLINTEGILSVAGEPLALGAAVSCHAGSATSVSFGGALSIWYSTTSQRCRAVSVATVVPRRSNHALTRPLAGRVAGVKGWPSR
jgi:hypothetical protein